MKMKVELTSLFSKFLPQLDIITVFKNDKSIGSFFKIKERLEPIFSSGIVYKYNCSSCNASYIGSTSRRLLVRISEHKGVSSRTGQISTTQSFSAIRDHCMEKDHLIKKGKNFQLLTDHILNLISF